MDASIIQVLQIKKRLLNQINKAHLSYFEQPRGRGKSYEGKRPRGRSLIN